MKKYSLIGCMFFLVACSTSQSSNYLPAQAVTHQVPSHQSEIRRAEIIQMLNAFELVNPDISRVQTDSDGNVISVGLRETSFGDSDMWLLSKLAHLELFAASQCNISDEGMAHLESHTSLTSVYLENTHITSKGLAFLADCQHMDRAYLCGTHIDDDALETLNQWQVLTAINVGDTSMTLNSIVVLAGLQSLKLLVVDDQQVLPGDLAMLEEAHPGLRIFVLPKK